MRSLPNKAIENYELMYRLKNMAETYNQEKLANQYAAQLESLSLSYDELQEWEYSD